LQGGGAALRQVAGGRSQVAGLRFARWQVAGGRWQGCARAVIRLPSSTHHAPAMINLRLRSRHHSSFIIHCSSFIIHHSLFIIHHSFAERSEAKNKALFQI